MSTAIILAARLGDIAGFLPVARDIYLKTGEKPDWLVNLHFSTIFGGVSYVNPIKIQWAYDRIDLSLELARKNHDRVINAQTFGRMYRGPYHLPFNKLAWDLNGYGESFDDKIGFPLVFDLRDPEREAMLCRRTLKGDKPVMLLSLACGRSSPFAAHQTFSDSIRRKWERYFQIVDLCKVRAARVYDVLGLMDRAALLITGDSLPVHLATASPKLPVIFLSNDQPFLASATRCNVVLRLKYSEWHIRIREVHHTIGAQLLRP